MERSQRSSFINLNAGDQGIQSGRKCRRCRIKDVVCDGRGPCSGCLANNVRCNLEILNRITPRLPSPVTEANLPDKLRNDGPRKLQYRVVLNAPTVMTRDQNQMPVTYLNKGRTYSISVTDQSPPTIVDVFYRSYVRVVFDDEEQRRQPEACWESWKSQRGFHEFRRRGRRCKAVEFIGGNEEIGTPSVARMELESASHDRFSVRWYPSPFAKKGCSMRLQFNFLSTDFSLPKLSKAAPVRLCIKTETKLPDVLTTKEHQEGIIVTSETNYCKIKLVKDQGVQREPFNDVAHVKECINKLEKKLANATRSDINHRPMKRKRNELDPSAVRPTIQDNPVVPADTPAERTTFIETSSGRSPRENEDLKDLETRIEAMYNMLPSTQPITILHLMGEDVDNPDLNPAFYAQQNQRDVREPSWRSSGGRKRSKSPISVHSQSSRGSSPPQSSSIGSNGGHITPDTIPFQGFEFESFEGKLDRRYTASWQIEAKTTPFSVNEYRYTPIEPDEVRLMVLYSGRLDDTILCGLKAMPLHRLEGSQLVYQALSYAWGLKTNLKEIWIENVQAPEKKTDAAVAFAPNSTSSPRKFHVRPNLYAALRRLRSESEDLWFWIDAICIDQENLVEKGHQLPRMLDIYCNAWSVCIWLGEAECPSNLRSHEPFDLIETIINLKLLDYILEGPSLDDQMILLLIAFAKLLNRPWFRRRWVIQEVSSSTRASVQYGHKKVNWIDFADATQLFMLKLDRIRALYRNSRLFESDPDAFSHVEAAGANAIVQATNDVVRKGEDGRIVGRLCDIETLVMRFVHFEATDPRDTIFALWSLADCRTAANDHLPTLDRNLTLSSSSYIRACESIYIDFICHCIKLHGSLDIICRHWALPFDNSLTSFGLPPIPSWIGTTANSPFGMHLGSGGRMNGDSLVGTPGHKVYDASGKSLPTVNVVPIQLTHTILQVTGHLISRVSQVSPRIVDGIIPYDALRLLGWSDRFKVDTIGDRLWRTLVADRTSDGSKAPSWWRRASMFALSMASRDGDLNTQRLLQNNSLPQTVREYLRRVQSVSWNRRVFALESAGASGNDASSSSAMVGLGPPDTRQDDYVCVLMGCSVLVVLRQVTHIKQEGLFELVGECFVHGMMDGEALESTSPDVRPDMRWFDLV